MNVQASLTVEDMAKKKLKEEKQKLKKSQNLPDIWAMISLVSGLHSQRIERAMLPSQLPVGIRTKTAS